MGAGARVDNVFDTIIGLPIHPLVVHAVVVLLPLAALGIIAIALRPTWRRTYGLLVLAITFVATAAVPVAKLSGEQFAKRVGLTPQPHARLGAQLIWFAIPLLVLALALVVGDRRWSRRAVTIVAALSVVAAVATTVQVVRIGHSGAKATWAGVVSAK
jgi:hypothetical protein